jgi:3-hydroxyisobutyrate dehydrogenase
MTTVAFVGLGAMGAPMAANLLRAGFPLRVYNRNPQRAAALAAQGAVVCPSAAEAVRGAQFAVSIVSDDTATREVMLGDEGIVAAAAPGTVILDSSTNTPGMSREVAVAAAARGCRYLDAPVSGSIAQARDRELVFMVGGDADAFERAQPLFAAMGRLNRLMGESGAGATIKLINNMLSATTTAALAEALAVAEAAGLDPAATGQILGEGAAASRLTRTKLPKIQSRDFTPQFQLALMEKDLRYFLALAQDVDRPAPIGSLIRSQLQAARRARLGELDVCAVFLHVTGGTPG